MLRHLRLVLTMTPNISSVKSIRRGITWCRYDAFCCRDDRPDAPDRGVEAQSKRLRGDHDSVCCRDHRANAPMEALRVQSFYISVVIGGRVAGWDMGLGVVSGNFHIIPRHHAHKKEQIPRASITYYTVTKRLITVATT